MASAWFPLHCHSHFSLLDGLSKPEQIASRCKELGFAGCAISDHGVVSGAIAFAKAMKKVGLKAILGNEVYVCPQDATNKEKENDVRSHLVVLAKNAEGWKGLISATSASNRPDFYYRKPRLDLDRLAAFGGGNFVTFSGHLGSDLANVCFQDYKAAYSSPTREAAKGYLWERQELRKRVLGAIDRYQQLFGRENFFLEIQLIDAVNSPAAGVVAEVLRKAAIVSGCPCVATADSHYPRPEDAEDQRILLCSAFETTLKEVERKMASEEDVSLGGFFKSNRYHIPALAEMQVLHTEDELLNSLAIAERCEAYDVLGKPILPQFPCPNGLTAEQYLRELAINGWRQKLDSRLENGIVKGMRGIGWSTKDVPLDVYKERIKTELTVVEEAGLAGYFLIVQDYCNFARSKGWLVGPGRGSGAGCLLSYLVGITGIDPLPYDLMFERFYNAGRNQPGRVSLPDIDCDFPITKRAEIIAYIQEKYGVDRVCQISTFSRLMGRGALKDVLRAHEWGTFDEWNKITEHIPDEAAIADELQAMREDGEEPSIIRWALENNAEKLRDWAYLDDEGNVEGPLKKLFAQAIRLEGTKRSQGKHAAGIVISAVPLADVCPMVHDKSSGQLYAGLEMGDLESIGAVKFDVLGIAALDKVAGVCELLATGKITT